MPAHATVFTPGNLVVSVYGNGDNSGVYSDNQASPIVLQELTTSGQKVSTTTLSQTTKVVNGVTQYAVSGEYGSSSEGFLQLSGDGHSLVIAGYAVNAATYNAGGAAVYGNAALAQSTSIQGGASTAVARVVAQIGADGTVDSSTALYNVFNTNNPRSVATLDGSSFYVSGQGVKGDTTTGLFVASKGASSATAVTGNGQDTRDVQIVNGAVYVSADVKNANTAIGTLPLGATNAGTPTALNGFAPTVTLTAGEANGINNSRIGKTVYISPEQFFFADANTLYVADSGLPKNGNTNAAGLGDGGLQKWIYDGTTWTLAYTLSAGLNLVNNAGTSGTTGLFGLTGTVIDGNVYLYATNSTIGDLDQSYLYAITDSLAATTLPGETFSTIYTAAADTKIKGVAFAPTLAAAVPEPASWAMMLAGFGLVGGLARRRRVTVRFA
ncbi:PEPxxWA-CTERM sorting domain-containing protein [Sphingomonas nostoxanthinifaciens]|nr:PEPxxWA-CTERM sorting domain-containing protein [Sphingomonas nostoxanthinifaciens]